MNRNKVIGGMAALAILKNNSSNYLGKNKFSFNNQNAYLAMS